MKKKKSKKTKVKFMSNDEAKKFLKKYDQLIFLESRKRTQLVGIATEDLMQECRIRLLSGFSTFDKNRSSEKTWVTHVIKKTLNGIWGQAFKKKRVNTINDQGKSIPIKDFNIDPTIRDGERHLSVTETYKGSPDGRPAFGTATYNPEECLQVLEALKFLKSKLPQESYELIKKELIPTVEQCIEPEIKFKKIKYEPTPPESYKENIVSLNPESGLDLWETQLMTQIADFFIDALGFNKRTIYGRMKTLDIVQK